MKTEQPLQWPLLPHGTPIPRCLWPASDTFAPNCGHLYPFAVGSCFPLPNRGKGMERSYREAGTSLSLPFGISTAPTAWDGGMRILCWLWLKSNGWVAPCTTQQVLNWGSDSWRCRSDTRLGALNQAQKSILSQRLGGVCDQHRTALHCSRALSWGPLYYLAPVSQHSLDQPNVSAAPQASKTSHWVEMPRVLAVSVAGGLQGHGSSVCVPEPPLWFPPTAPNWVGTCCWKGPSWTAAAPRSCLQTELVRLSQSCLDLAKCLLDRASAKPKHLQAACSSSLKSCLLSQWRSGKKCCIQRMS